MGIKSQVKTRGAMLGMSAAMIFGFAACNEHPVSMSTQRGLIEVQEVVAGSSAEKLDILWMIDNSGSMCRSQGVLREGIRDFVEILGELNLDFHIGVTTTHMKERAEYPLEPIALPGRLQSKPQPIPGFDTACHHPVDNLGQPIRDDFGPVIENIQVAIGCTENPEEWAHLANPDIRALQCTLDDLYYGCEPGEGPSIETFFPDPSAYRDIPLVLRSEDYSDASGALELDRLAADFGCMSLVGTRGFGYEMGLASVVKAVSPELTGGPGADPAEFPNAGFLRDDSRLSVIFIADENDCSHDGSLVLSADGEPMDLERSTCGVHQCTIQENLGEDGSLIPVSSLRKELMANYAMSKGLLSAEEAANASYNQLMQLVGNDIVPASIHGRHQIDDTAAPEMCIRDYSIAPSCQSTFGIAWSGHRYAEFISDFPTFFPDPRRDPLEAVILEDMEGYICGDFEPALRDIANMLAPPAGGCIGDIYRCDGPDDFCPSNPSTGAEGTCTRYPSYGPNDENALYYCDSGLEIRLVLPPANDDLSRLENTGFCVEGTIDPVDFPKSCVVDPANYDLIACGSGASLNVDFSRVHPQWAQILDGLEVIARYTRLPWN